MTTQAESPAQPRIPLSRERVLRAAVSLADEGGIGAVSMRKVGNELGVEAMSLYNHVANKEEMLDGMVDIVVGEIDLAVDDVDWKSTMRSRMMSARQILVQHKWAAAVLETRTNMTPPMIKYMDSFIGIFREGGFSSGLTHHAMHALGSRVLGFTQEMFDDSEALEANPEVKAMMLQQMKDQYPNISAMLVDISHEDGGETVGDGCDDDVEFVFAVDLILDGLERLRDAE
ncbi:MAG: TetR family transcriptional regulator [bacterium]|nr:TetR family transcriptional regulator [bacterium]